MGEVKNRTYYFYKDMIKLKNFVSNLLKIDKKSYKSIGIYNIGDKQLEKLIIIKYLLCKSFVFACLSCKRIY